MIRSRGGGGSAGVLFPGPRMSSCFKRGPGRLFQGQPTVEENRMANQCFERPYKILLAGPGSKKKKKKKTRTGMHIHLYTMFY